EAKNDGYSFESVKESQDICFFEGEYGDFIKQNIPENSPRIKKGDITDVDGNFLGKHKGYVYYTIGQRKGLSLGSGPWYVVEIDSKRNRVIVGRDFHQGQNKFTIEKCNWFIEVSEGDTIECNVMVRYNSSEFSCKAEINANSCATVFLEEKTVITPGQSAVFYKDDLVIGGGIICSTDAASCAATGTSVRGFPCATDGQCPSGTLPSDKAQGCGTDAASRMFSGTKKIMDKSTGYISLSRAATGTPSETSLAREVVSIHRDADKQLGAGLQKLNLENPFSISEKAEIYYKETTYSTMNDARELIPQNPHTGTLVLAYDQTEGKGRIEGRRWLSVKGESLTFTILVKNSDIEFPLSLFPLFAGFCIAGFLKKEFGIESSIKWPNDVLINGKKISGILCENSSGYVLCGIGINCNQKNTAEISRKKGVSIFELTGIFSDLNDLLLKFLGFMKDNWDNKTWKDDVSKQLHNKGKKVVFFDSLTGKDNPITGIIEGIGEDGELIMTEESTGQRKKYYSGEISFS
ncbi:MAG: biotin--[acetyl-CoA-carboxylase] ligase, partial [Spirochaetaceae bacterium]|nr:biotin--[acetyl-CoA-carboxylase] ligase [Spirochaetaceae bacterium]